MLALLRTTALLLSFQVRAVWSQQEASSNGNSPDPKTSSHSTICPSFHPPDRSDKAKSARWLLHSLDWAVLSTISSRMDSSPPFGNIVSLLDGPCDQSTGTVYVWGSHMDQSFIDLETNSNVSLTMSQRMMASGSGVANCLPATGGDPENPMCARLVMTGELKEMSTNDSDYNQVKKWFYERHPAVKEWPDGHEWVIAKLHLQDIWFINFFGGPSVIDPQDFARAALDLQIMIDSGRYGSSMTTSHESFECNPSSRVWQGIVFLAVIVVVLFLLIKCYFGSRGDHVVLSSKSFPADELASEYSDEDRSIS